MRREIQRARYEEASSSAIDSRVVTKMRMVEKRLNGNGGHGER